MNDYNVFDMQTVDLSKYNYVSFDVFDTLIFRSVAEPEDLYKMVQEVYFSTCGYMIKDFCTERISAERKARDFKKEREITFDEIYDNLKYDSKIKNELKDIELQVELDNCIPNIPMIDYLKKCQKTGKTIVVTTDMYLPRCFFERLLNKLKIHVDFIFISSEEGETKRTGKLYPIMLKKLGIFSNQILHIGDNKVNDILQAQRYGIDAIERWHDIMINPVKFKHDNVIENHINTLYALYNKREYNQSAYYVGFFILGPFLYDFCYWLHDQKKNNNLSKLVFLAREGYLIYNCYNLLFPEDKNVTLYIALNKNLLRLPLLHENKSLMYYKESLLSRNSYTWDQIFDSFLVCEDVVARNVLSNQIGVNYHQPISREELYTGVYDKELTLLIDLYSSTIHSQSDYLYKYLEQHDMLNGKIGLVNNSINGNGQVMLELFMKQKGLVPNIFGLQFIDSLRCLQKLDNRYTTYFNSLELTYYSKNEFYRNCLLFEHLLFEPIGSASSFEINGGVINIVNKLQFNEVYNNAFVEELQRHTISFIDVYKNHVPLICRGLGVKRFLDFIHFPDYKNAKPLCDLWDEDADGARKIADSTIPLQLSYIVLKKIPNTIIWIEGYLSTKGVSKIWLLLTQIRLALIYYRNNKLKFLKDIKIFINHFFE